MDQAPHSDCAGALLDALSYELLSGRLSPEIVGVIRDHVRECAGCRRSMKGFIDLLEEETPERRTGSLAPSAMSRRVH